MHDQKNGDIQDVSRVLAAQPHVDTPSPLLPECLTIIITTSPTPSAPLPELVESVIASLPSELRLVPLIVTFDGYTISQSIKRTDGRLKRGQIPQHLADVYPEYINNVKKLFGSIESGHAFDLRMHTHISSIPASDKSGKIAFVQHKYRQGFAFSIKSALLHCTTPLVLILQHDWVFTGPQIPISQLINILATEPEVSYISFVARQSRKYEHTRGASHSRYRAVFQASREIRRGRKDLQNDLIACLHFFDRPHLCKVSLYNEIFESGLVKRGDFVEDTVGTEYLMSIANSIDDATAIKAWQRYKAWLYSPSDGDQAAIRHTSGRTCLAKDDQEARIRDYIESGRARKSQRIVD